MIELTKIDNQEDTFYVPFENQKVKVLVDALRLVAVNSEINSRTLYIQDNCEKYGFIEGYHNLGELLYFLADMLEE
jgi:hypothetical protein